MHVWGKPALDREQQILRMTDISLAVESEAAFGLLGAAARAAMPYLQAALAEERGHRSETLRRQCARQHREGDRRFPPAERRRARSTPP